MTTDRPERLAAYLSGDLDADERAEIEAELASDPQLRARLEAIRRADEALADLPAPSPREGFSERLRTTVDEELADRLDRQPADELAARRRPAWRAPMAAAATLVAVLAGIGVVVATLTGGGADSTGVQETTVDQLEADGAEGAGEADRGAAGEATGRPPPLITASGRDYDEPGIRRATGTDRFGPLAGRALTPAAAAEVADRRLARLRSGTPETTTRDATATPEADDQARPASPAPAPPEAAALSGPAVTPEQVAAVRRCLPQVLDAAPQPVIPAFVELARFDGQPVILYGLLTEHPDRGTVTRPGVWVVARDDCTVRLSTQDGSTG